MLREEVIYSHASGPALSYLIYFIFREKAEAYLGNQS
jgi:hypothetical protein